MTFFIRKSADNQYYWYLRSDNNEIVCTSETYTTKAAAEKTCESVKAKAKDASIIDLT